MDIQPTDPTPRQRAEEPNQHQPRTEEGGEISAGQGSAWSNPDASRLGETPHISDVDTELVLSPRQVVAASNGQPSVLRQPPESTPGESESSRMADAGALPPRTERQLSKEPVAAEGAARETEHEDSESFEAPDPPPTDTGAQLAATDQSPSAGTRAGAKPQSSRRRNEPRSDNPSHRFWHQDIVPLLEADHDNTLNAAGIVRILMERHPEAFDDRKSDKAIENMADSLRPWIKRWRMANGRLPSEDEAGSAKSPASKDQNNRRSKGRLWKHKPGQEIQVDFTHIDTLEITIQGESKLPLLFTARLPYSGWTYVEVFGGETVAALSRGLQNAFRMLGGVPKRVRKDRHVSAIWHGRPIPPFDLVRDHYGFRLKLIKQRSPWQNGSIERLNGTIKGFLKQILQARGSRDFGSRQEFDKAVQRAVNWNNRKPAVQRKLKEERMAMRSLPKGAVPSYKTVEQNVGKYGWIKLYGYFYSVPPGMGKRVLVRMYDDKIEVYREDPNHPLAVCLQPVIIWPRSNDPSKASIDHRHVLPRLAGKPTALNGFPKEVKAEMFPRRSFMETHRKLKKWCRLPAYRTKRRPWAPPGWGKWEGHSEYEYVRVLALCVDPNREEEVDQILQGLLATGQPFYYQDVEELMTASPGRKLGVWFQRLL